MNLIKVMNFSGAAQSRSCKFTGTRRGLHRPEPAVVHSAFFGQRNALGLARRIEGILAEASVGGSRAQPPRGPLRSITGCACLSGPKVITPASPARRRHG